MSEVATGMAWGDLRETSAVMSAVKGRHDDFAVGTLELYQIK
jgi:hypothetical protein